ncbi:MAG: hypothetical protein WC813_00775 [Patescibacteria group bacterium]
MFDQEPQDIFAGTDKAPAPVQPPSAVERASVNASPRPAPAMAPAPVMSAPRQPMEPSPTSHLMRNLVIIVIVIAAVGGGAYLAYALMIKPIMNASVAPVIPSAVKTPVVPAEETPLAPVETPVETPVAAPAELNPNFLDSDGDGLNNAAELEAGTSSTNPDTDGDGLGDREEVRVYGTDPNRTDTDGDGFLDGAEVQGGYNPNGPGKLMQIPTTP